MYAIGARTMKVFMWDKVSTLVNGYRSKFTPNLFKKSALSCHIYRDHPEKVGKKLRNYELGIIKASSPADLDRLEDFYVDITHSKLSLNRYKPTR